MKSISEKMKMVIVYSWLVAYTVLNGAVVSIKELCGEEFSPLFCMYCCRIGQLAYTSALYGELTIYYLLSAVPATILTSNCSLLMYNHFYRLPFSS